jgi:DNA-binding CsgD family transcriptional regulator
MDCPACGSPTKVTKVMDRGALVFRRRSCSSEECSYRFDSREEFSGPVGRQGGFRAGVAKLTLEEVAQVKLLLSEGVLSQSEIGRMFSISQAAVSQIHRGVRWSYVATAKP